MLCKQKKALWMKWINVNISNCGPLYKEYKEAKVEFRKAQNKAIMEYEIKNMNEITKCQEMDQKYFWYIVNKHKRKGRNVHPIKTKAGIVLTKPGDICNEWKTYFQDLYTPQSNNYDKEFQHHVDESIVLMTGRSYLNKDYILEKPITRNEVKTAIKGLKRNKAPGFDNITAECFHYAGEKFIKCLVKLFNILCVTEYIPCQFKKGVIVPIPKGDKDKSCKDNYRGITLLTVISKVYEKCIIKRVENWATMHNMINFQQGAAQRNCSSIHVSWLVQETIAKYIEQDKTVYVSMLDTKKAYDSVWQKGLFYILFEAGLNGKTWRMLMHLYDKFI